MPPGEVRINPAQSLYLDLLRGVAALAVVFYHYSRHIAQVGHEAFPDVGQEAVMIFFVMSGFVIAMVADGKERDFRTFAAKRLARFYSVVIPVSAILLACYLVTIRIDVNAYEWWGDLSQWPAKLLATFAFSTETALWHNFTLPGGAPMWSMSYEFWYYFVFAFAVLLPDRALGGFLAVVCALWIGLDGMLLFVIWLMGVAAFHLYKRVVLPRWLALAMAVGGALGVVALQISGVRYSHLEAEVFLRAKWEHAEFFPYYYLVGLCLVANILGALTLLSGPRAEPRGFAPRAIRHVAHTAFFLYLTHMPVMFLLKAVFGGLVFPYLIPALACGIAQLVGKPVEDLRFPLQRWLLPRKS